MFDAVGGARRGHVRDRGQLDEDEGGDHGEDQDGAGRPEQLEPRVAVHLRALDVAPAPAAAVLPDEDDEQRLDDHEDRGGEDEDQVVRVGDALRVRRVRVLRGETAVGGRGCSRRREDGEEDERENRQLPSHPSGHSMGVSERTRVEVPPHVPDDFEVFVSGVRQEAGVDFERIGRSLVFPRPLAQEGRLGFWRWASMWLGIAGTYRKNESGRPRLRVRRPPPGRDRPPARGLRPSPAECVRRSDVGATSAPARACSRRRSGSGRTCASRRACRSSRAGGGRRRRRCGRGAPRGGPRASAAARRGC